MTEMELRQAFVNVIRGWLGLNKYSQTHRPIVDLYNTITPLPVGYKLTYNDAYCAATPSAAAWKLGITDIVFPECGTGRMIDLYKKAGRWVEDDAYTPQVGDLIMYNWDDNGCGDCDCHSSHVGTVADVNGKHFRVIEGNTGWNGCVGYREMEVNGRYIRGYCCPDFASKASGASPEWQAQFEAMRKELQDNEASAWSKEARDWAVDNGIINGIGTLPDGTTNYAWEDFLTREQMVTILYRALYK